MATNVVAMDCTPEDVFRVLANGWLYPSWVVGASRMRGVDSSWPGPGAELHHSVGVWPFLLDDTTQMTAWEPPHRVVMRARGWPVGEADIALTVRARENGCLVRIQEDAVSGPAALIPRVITTPILRWRNGETMRRLRFLAEGRAH